MACERRKRKFPRKDALEWARQSGTAPNTCHAPDRHPSLRRCRPTAMERSHARLRRDGSSIRRSGQRGKAAEESPLTHLLALMGMPPLPRVDCYDGFLVRRGECIRILTAVSLAAVLVATPACTKKPEVSAGIDLVGMDTSVAPGDDFNAYTNGGWIKATPIPADKSSYGVGAILVGTQNLRTLEIQNLRCWLLRYLPSSPLLLKQRRQAIRRSRRLRPRNCSRRRTRLLP
jgi:hypothetical protein